MNICFSVTNLESGGAQTFVLRLAQSFAEQGHQVFIYDHWPELRDKKFTEVVPASVRIVSYCENPFLRAVIWKTNALLKSFRLHKSWRHSFNARQFRRFLHSANIQVLSSHMSFSDFVCASAGRPRGCLFVPTLHGEYELGLTENRDQDELAVNVNRVIKNSDVIIYTANKNLSALKKLGKELPQRILKVGIGVDRESLLSVLPATRSLYGIGTTDFVLGMIGRGIPDKGWDVAIRAARKSRLLTKKRIVLLLVGTGTYLSDLFRNNGDTVNDQLMDFNKSYHEYLSVYRLFDLFIFPSTFAGESVPNVVIESLGFNVPVLASRHAEIPSMLKAGTPEAAGICVDTGAEMEDRMAAEIARLADHDEPLRSLKHNCARAFDPYDLRKVTGRYLDIFESRAGTTHA